MKLVARPGAGSYLDVFRVEQTPHCAIERQVGAVYPDCSIALVVGWHPNSHPLLGPRSPAMRSVLEAVQAIYEAVAEPAPKGRA